MFPAGMPGSSFQEMHLTFERYLICSFFNSLKTAFTYDLMILSMPGHLRMVIVNNIGIVEFSNFMGRAGSNEKVHLMVSDGIMVDFLRQFPENVARTVMVERILTSYQLQKTLMETDESPHFIGIRSEVISSWESDILQSIYDILKIKSYYHGCMIYFYVVGEPGPFMEYLGRRFLSPARNVESKVEGGLYSWEEQH